MPGLRVAPETYGRYGIRAELQVYFTQPNSLIQLESGLTGRLKDRFETETENVTSRSFLVSMGDILKSLGMTHVTTIEIDDYYVFWSEVEAKESWNEAFMTALNSKQISNEHGEVYLISNGVTKDFKFEQDIQFRPKHALDHPTISILIRATPAEWIPSEGEDLQAFSDRLTVALADKQGVNVKEAESREKIQRFLGDYQQKLRGTFPVAKISQELMVDLGAIVVKDFRVEARLEKEAETP
ncbi:MAG TPA: hypothetical protein VEC08_04395 [Nitrososphaerales archaeon]|nr:hypothetical protein [Nitrososphaerales archaeon]